LTVKCAEELFVRWSSRAACLQACHIHKDVAICHSSQCNHGNATARVQQPESQVQCHPHGFRRWPLSSMTTFKQVQHVPPEIEWRQLSPLSCGRSRLGPPDAVDNGLGNSVGVSHL